MTPNFFIIGAPKCGTSSLAQYLAEHSEVFFSPIKEPFYWCDDFRTSKHEFKANSLSEYLALFEESQSQHKAIGEGSTRYLMSKTAVKRILEFNPDSRFIVMLRNPVEAVQAYHMEQVYSLHEDVDDFEEAWSIQEERLSGRSIPKKCSEPLFLQYGRVYKYGEQLERLFETVSRDKVKVIIFDDFKESALTAYKESLDFLEGRYDGRIEFPVLNSSHKHRFKWLSNLVLSPPEFFSPAVLFIRQWLISHRFPLVESIKKRLNVKSQRNYISSDLELRLKEYFRKDVEDLSNIIGRDLTGWTK